ncbi:MAG: hypothetical protein JNL02_02065 [Saprospiraceae bacterium]|nr:hypothetical protein [Saprospiraceae bacterium]
MENSRLFRLLRTFNSGELRHFKKFLRTPFFNQRSEVPALFDLLEKSLKTGRPAPAKNEAWRRLFGAGDYDDHRVRLAMSQLYKLATQFLAVQDFLADAPAFQRRAARAFQTRRLPDLAQTALSEAAAAQEKLPLRNPDFFEEQYRITLDQNRFAVAEQNTEAIDFQQLSRQLDQTFLIQKLWQACYMLSHQAVANTRYDFGLLDATLEFAARSGALDTPAAALYFHCYHALTHPEEHRHFQQFKTLLFHHDRLFSVEERRDLFILAINFCIRQYNAGSHDYLREQFDFYRTGLERQYFLSDGVLSRYTYLNAATSGMALQELDWTEHFIQSYRDYLAEAHRESLFSFNLARLEYQRRAHGAALQLLQKTDYKDLPLNLAAKTLQLKIYYELGEYDLLESHLKAFGAFIRRKKMLGYHRTNYLNTVLFAQKMLELNRYDKNAVAALRREVEETAAVAEKEWLLGML